MDDFEYAAQMAADRSLGAARETGLVKLCPRCSRRGRVFTTARAAVLVVWEGEPRNPFGNARDADSIAGFERLAEPTLGCGYCVAH